MHAQHNIVSRGSLTNAQISSDVGCASAVLPLGSRYVYTSQSYEWYSNVQTFIANLACRQSSLAALSEQVAALKAERVKAEQEFQRRERSDQQQLEQSDQDLGQLRTRLASQQEAAASHMAVLERRFVPTPCPEGIVPSKPGPHTKEVITTSSDQYYPTLFHYCHLA